MFKCSTALGTLARVNFLFASIVRQSNANRMNAAQRISTPLRFICVYMLWLRNSGYTYIEMRQ